MLIVENGTGENPDANSYVSVADADAYATLRGLSAWLDLAESEKEKHLILATDYMQTRFQNKVKSCPVLDTQPLLFPRQSWELIPPQIKRACILYALKSAAGELSYGYESDTTGLILTMKRDRVEGAVETERQYAPNQSLPNFKPYPEIDSFMSIFLKSSNNAVEYFS